MGRPPIGKTAMTDAERQRRHRAQQAVTKPVTKPAQPDPATAVLKARIAELDPASLSATAQKKLETAIRQHKRQLDAQFSQAVNDRVKEVLDNWLPDYEQKLREAERVINTYEGLISRADFRKIWACLHPDRGASQTMLAEAFDIFSKHEQVLVKKEKEQRTPKMPFPRTYAEAMAMKQAVKEQRRAKH
jgi:hypothetical protein